MLRFILAFVLCFGVLTGAFEATRGSPFERVMIERLILDPTATVINIVTPSEHVERHGRFLQSPGSALRVTRGCEGVELLLLLLAAVLAFPASLTQRVRGLLIGGALAYALAVSRLMALHYTLRHAPALWEMLHGFIMSLLPVLALALFFLHWTGSVQSTVSARRAPAPMRAPTV